MGIYFLSDTHYGHTNIVGPTVSNWDAGYRDFNSLKEMNYAIIKSINDNVEEYDTLYFLGDWSFGHKSNIEVFREQINCRNIHMVLGNHDTNITRNNRNFSSVHDYLELEFNKLKIVLSHYPMRVWNKSHRGSYHLFGHLHHTILNFGKSMDVGWCEYRKPLSLDEIVDKLKDRKQEEYWGQDVIARRTSYKL